MKGVKFAGIGCKQKIINTDTDILSSNHTPAWLPTPLLQFNQRAYRVVNEVAPYTVGAAVALPRCRNFA